jgi:hypothetical protein
MTLRARRLRLAALLTALTGAALAADRAGDAADPPRGLFLHGQSFLLPLSEGDHRPLSVRGNACTHV